MLTDCSTAHTHTHTPTHTHTHTHTHTRTHSHTHTPTPSHDSQRYSPRHDLKHPFSSVPSLLALQNVFLKSKKPCELTPLAHCIRRAWCLLIKRSERSVKPLLWFRGPHNRRNMSMGGVRVGMCDCEPINLCVHCVGVDDLTSRTSGRPYNSEVLSHSSVSYQQQHSAEHAWLVSADVWLCHLCLLSSE
jgi:hypothetical protein